MKSLSVFCNLALPAGAAALLRGGLGAHRLLVAARPLATFGGKATPDPQLAGADVAFGQPDPDQVIASPRVRWVHLSSAGYTAYDRDDLREALRRREGTLTKSSLVYDEPCAQHLLAFLTAQARQLPAAFASQQAHGWPQLLLRQRSRLLTGEKVVLVGYGSIGRRLAELLAPLRMEVLALRRHVHGDEAVRTLPIGEGAAALAAADHVIDLLPATAETERFFDDARFAGLKRGAVFYNVGRGSTVDQHALARALASGVLAAAYLDVTTPEPLPPEHPLWATPCCFITPHTAGGHADEPERLVRHFLDNLARHDAGAPLLDRVF